MEITKKIKSSIRNNLILSILLLIVFVLFVIPILVVLFGVLFPTLNEFLSIRSGFDDIKVIIDAPNLQEELKSLVVNPNTITQQQLNEINLIIDKFNNLNSNPNEINNIITELSQKISSLGILSEKGNNLIKTINQANVSLNNVNNISKEWFNIDINQFIIDMKQNDNDLSKYISNILSSKLFSILILSLVSLFLYLVLAIIMIVRGIIFSSKNNKNEECLKMPQTLITLNIVLSFLAPFVGWIIWLIAFISYKKKLKLREEKSIETKIEINNN